MTRDIGNRGKEQGQNKHLKKAKTNIENKVKTNIQKRTFQTKLELHPFFEFFSDKVFLWL